MKFSKRKWIKFEENSKPLKYRASQMHFSPFNFILNKYSIKFVVDLLQKLGNSYFETL